MLGLGGALRGALEWVDGDEGVERYRADGRVALTGAGEDRDRRVGPDETVAGEERRALGFTIGEVVGVADEHVPVPALLAGTVHQMVQARPEREGAGEHPDREHSADHRGHDREPRSTAPALDT